MDRRHVESFLAVADCGSVSAAARQLGVSQPTLSATISHLEAQCGTPLFHRSARGVRLTEAGAELLGPAGRVVRAFEALDSALSPERRLDRGRLTIACPRTLAHDPTTRIVSRFRQAHRKIKVSIVRPLDGQTAGDVVLSGRADVGIGADGRSRAELVVTRLCEQRVVALVPPGADVSATPDVDELVALGLIVSPRGAATRRLLAERIGEPAVAAATRVESTATGLMVPLVRAGIGVAFVADAMTAEAELAGVEVRVTEPPMVRDVWLVHGRVLSPAASAFVELALDEVGVRND